MGVALQMLARAYFATSSDIKFRQYAHIAADYDIQIERGTVISSALTEPQGSSNDIREMSNLVFHPLRLSARFVSMSGQTPYFVEDTMLVVDGISNYEAGQIGLPGPDTKNWWLNLGAKGTLKLLESLVDRKARYICQIGIFYGAGHYSFHQAETRGFITTEERTLVDSVKKFPATNPYFFHSIFGITPEGPTLAELDGTTFRTYDYRRACFEKLAVDLARVMRSLNFENSRKQLELF
jgi:inosine/xanthosine triphosphate pyrophosphatase family protein